MDYIKALRNRINDIYDDIEAEKRQKDGRATIAIVKDASHVIIGKEVYPADCATDVYMIPGKEVYVQVSALGSAIVIGD